MNYQNYFKGKKITMMGLGLLGRGVGDAKFLAECGAKLLVTDLKTEEDLKESLKTLKDFSNIDFHLGGHKLEDFQNCDMVIKSAGVPINSPFILEAEKRNIPVKMSTSLFAEFTESLIIGITGTRGKSTVTAMIFEILKKVHSIKSGQAGKKVFLGGNVKGVSTLAHLPESTKDEISVLELDSWQLQGFGELRKSPHIAVFTTFMQDHLNYYGSTSSPQVDSMKRYLDDKANIFKYQTKDDFLILGEQVAEKIQTKYKSFIKSKIIIAKQNDLPKSWELKIPGEHNRYNASCAMAVAKILGIEEKIIKEALLNFKGVSGRLELIKEIEGVKIYNDTTATTPAATMVALQALGSRQIGSRNLILILGGADKGIEMDELLAEIPKYCKAVILLPGTGTERLIFNFQLLIIKVSNLEEAIKEAMQNAEEGDIILFSPAFASFGMFKNEFDRGEKFNNLIKSLKL